MSFFSIKVLLYSVLFLGVQGVHTLGTKFCLVLTGSWDQRVGEDPTSRAARWAPAEHSGDCPLSPQLLFCLVFECEINNR